MTSSTQPIKSPTNGSPVAFAGVVTVPPGAVHASIKAQVDAALHGVKQGKTMAILTVKTGVVVSFEMGLQNCTKSCRV